MVEDTVCAACGALITSRELAMEGVVRVLGRTGRVHVHPRCFEWSEEPAVTEQ